MGEIEFVEDCIFCKPDTSRVYLASDLCVAIWDAFPVTASHALIIPRRHVCDYFALSADELLACHELLRETREWITAHDPLVEGFNVGINAGEVAGQTVFHCHIHLIPRRKGDVANPRGGVRHVIPGKGAY